MHRRRLSSLVLAAAVAVLPLAASAQALPSRQNNQGQVMVSVTPLALSKTAETWKFDVRLNTHVAPITQDLASVALLGDGNGHEERPLSWEGDPPGGHHRKGVLSFKPISPMPASVVLSIRDVGSVPVRSFTWQVAQP